MKYLKYTYIPLCCIVVFLFGITANAAVSTVSASTTTINGQNVTFSAQSYTNYEADEFATYDNGSVVTEIQIHNLSQNIYFTLPGASSKYYSGYVKLRISIGLPTNGDLRDVVSLNTFIDDGLKQFITEVGSNYFDVVVMFDNYFARSTGNTSLNTITYKVTSPLNQVSGTNITTTISVRSSYLNDSEAVTNNALTGMIWSAIVQGTGQNFADIITLLTSIKNQDLTYYVSIVNSLASLHTDNQQLHSDLSSILNELDLDFQSVQTVLDLFPSYRTQVLSYWQQLLEMSAAQSSAAADLGNDYASKETQSASLLQGFSSITKPSVSSSDLNILGNVDFNTKTNFFGLISLITNNSLITTMLLIIVTGMIAGYILYGKKG